MSTSLFDISNYDYALSVDRIAYQPTEPRDHSRLLIYRNNEIIHSHFFKLPELIPPGALLVFNNTKVIPARMLFTSATGAIIEVLLLEPLQPAGDYAHVLNATGHCTWKCMIGNLKRWKENYPLTIHTEQIQLRAKLLDRHAGSVEFSWNLESLTFSDVIGEGGLTPLPPYIKRPPVLSDKMNYQTIYSTHEGAVAAPTAGLHFSKDVMEGLLGNRINMEFLTLYVGAGTFMPIKVDDVREHNMHPEKVIVNRSTIEKLMTADFVIPVGTTSVRTLESLYWYGVKLNSDPSATFEIDQGEPYAMRHSLPDRRTALEKVLVRMDRDEANAITGSTSLFIYPGYRFRFCHALITNFHQPRSSLLLLIAALTGNSWRQIYKEALGTGYRFLSYGDSSLLYAGS